MSGSLEGDDGRCRELLERAQAAAARGSADDLESILIKLRQVAPDEAFLVQDRLRSIARSVEAHPSFGPQASRAAS